VTLFILTIPSLLLYILIVVVVVGVDKCIAHLEINNSPMDGRGNDKWHIYGYHQLKKYPQVISAFFVDKNFAITYATDPVLQVVHRLP
jgi:hypothetical protein